MISLCFIFIFIVIWQVATRVMFWNHLKCVQDSINMINSAEIKNNLKFDNDNTEIYKIDEKIRKQIRTIGKVEFFFVWSIKTHSYIDGRYTFSNLVLLNDKARIILISVQTKKTDADKFKISKIFVYQFCYFGIFNNSTGGLLQ